MSKEERKGIVLLRLVKTKIMDEKEFIIYF